MKPNSKRYITCPFCSLHCDDIQVEVNNNKFKIISENIKDCTSKIEYFNIKNSSNLSARISNKKISFKKAIDSARKMINNSNDITLVNHGTDVNGVRSLLNFAANYNCVVDHVNSKYLYRNLGIIQRKGYMATSLTETRNRSDVVILFGNNILKKSPRLIDKVIFPKHSLCTNLKSRKLLLFGDFDARSVKKMKSKYRVEHFKIDLNDTPEILSKLMSEDKLTKNLEGIRKTIKKSKYLVASWTTSDFDKCNDPDYIISSISDFILLLNKTSRAACMPIAGSLADATSSQTMSWITGFPSRVKFNGKSFFHDRNICNSQEIISNQNTDLAIHISTVNHNKVTLNGKIKNIFIGHINSTFNIKPDIFIPVGNPGIDHRGIMFRTDNVVSVLLDKIRENGLLSTQDVMNMLSGVHD